MLTTIIRTVTASGCRKKSILADAFTGYIAPETRCGIDWMRLVPSSTISTAGTLNTIREIKHVRRWNSRQTSVQESHCKSLRSVGLPPHIAWISSREGLAGTVNRLVLAGSHITILIHGVGTRRRAVWLAFPEGVSTRCGPQR